MSKVFSNDLCEALVGLEARPWSEWRRDKPITANGVARLLTLFGIRPRSIRIGSKEAENLNEVTRCDGVTVGNAPERGLQKNHPERARQQRLRPWPEDPSEEVGRKQARDAGEELVL